MSVQDLIQQVQQAAASGQPLNIQGGGSKRFLGGPLLGQPLSTLGLRGIVAYEPSELFITARAGTPLVELEAELARSHQHLAFEPPHYAYANGDPVVDPRVDGAAAGPTAGGMVAAGLSGPARVAAGSVRDHVLGATLLNGRGEVLRFGGQVMKNVAGFDISRLLAGSMGTLGVILDVTLKVLPLPPAEATLRFECDEGRALEQLNQWAGQPWPLAASAWWDGTLVLRLRGAEPAVRAAVDGLGGERLPDALAQPFWRGLRDHADEFFARARDAVRAGGSQGVGLWRLALPSTAPPLRLPGEQLVEWHGAQRWLCSAAPAAAVRRRAAELGGHALLFYGQDACGDATRRRLAHICPPLPAPLDRIHRELKRSFDPAGVFNRQRWYDDGYADVAPPA